MAPATEIPSKLPSMAILLFTVLGRAVVIIRPLVVSAVDLEISVSAYYVGKVVPVLYKDVLIYICQQFRRPVAAVTTGGMVTGIFTSTLLPAAAW